MAHLNRRAFFGLLAGVAVGAELDLDRLLWRPKLISIPKPPPIAPFTVGDIEIVTADWVPRGMVYFCDPELVKMLKGPQAKQAETIRQNQHLLDQMVFGDIGFPSHA